MKPRAVVDTNVMVSGLLGGTATEVIRRWRMGAFDLVLSAEILTEYEAVLNRPKFRLPPRVVQELLGYVRAQATWVVPSSELAVASRDPSDTKFLRAGVAGQAGLIITEGKDLLDMGEFQGGRIVTPWHFLSLL
jgi:putative PIN family toxin of toxin-antitoxin system